MDIERGYSAKVCKEQQVEAALLAMARCGRARSPGPLSKVETHVSV